MPNSASFLEAVPNHSALGQLLRNTIPANSAVRVTPETYTIIKRSYLRILNRLVEYEANHESRAYGLAFYREVSSFVSELYLRMNSATGYEHQEEIGEILVGFLAQELLDKCNLEYYALEGAPIGEYHANLAGLIKSSTNEEMALWLMERNGCNAEHPSRLSRMLNSIAAFLSRIGAAFNLAR